MVKGRPLAEIEASLGQVAEGIATTAAAYALGRREEVELPIVEQMHAVLFEGKPPLEAVAALMQREAKHELEGIRKTIRMSG